MKFFLLFLTVFFFNFSHAQVFNIAKFSIGEDRIKISLKDFDIKYTNSEIETNFVDNSVQWIRNESNILLPRALLHIKTKNTLKNTSLNYAQKRIYPVIIKDEAHFVVYVDLFNPTLIELFSQDKSIDKIQIEAKKSLVSKSKQLIDYSCSPYSLSIEGIDHEFLSVGCKLERVGSLFNEKPRLEVTINSTNLKTESNERIPFTIYLADNNPAALKVIDSENKEQEIKVQAKLPKKLSRFKTALGLGPYIYESHNGDLVANDQIAPSLMIYGKFDFTEKSSLKAFDALIYSKSFFNNGGVYFSYDLATIFDERILLNTLIGFQGLSYRYSKGGETTSSLIYPQGFEVILKHAFGIENKHLIYGMFLSTSSSEPYTNSWIRYGGKVFYELNYINWKKGDKKMTMSGVSIGFPFFEAL